MRLSHVCSTVLCLVLAGCGSTPDRYPVSTPTIAGSERIGFSSVEIRDLSLPAYAAADEIPYLDETGKLVSDGSVLWADSPARAIALELSRHLTQLTKAQIAPSPWPFEKLPQASLDIRFETVLAHDRGNLQVAGQYFLGRLDSGRERSGVFDLSVPIAQPQTPATVASARGEAIAQLSKVLAQKALK
jgi:uncharacterized lipoprotein YmbA